MPEPVDARQRYVPGLDGLRAIAVLAVIAYHVQAPWLPGGLLGVGVFFTLSGYLITDLLLAARERTGNLGLSTFWLRRARRLLPALSLMLVVVVAWVTVVRPGELAALRGQVVAALLYVSNWWLVLHHVSYFARFGPPSPLGHLWSLAVEEQFYLVWPWLLLLGLKVLRRRRWLVLATLALAAASSIEMALLYHPGFDPSRVYDGTDTRAAGLLLGAALAMVWPSRHLREDVSRAARWVVDGFGVVGLLAVVALMVATTQYSPFLYRGGMALLAVATALVVAAVVHPAGRLGRALGWRPLSWLGERSYGIYLWHYPVIVLTSPAVDRGFDLPRASVQVGASILLAALSWRFVEEPIRHGALGRVMARVRAGWSSARPHGTLPLAGALAAMAVVVVAGMGLAGGAGALGSLTAAVRGGRQTAVATGAQLGTGPSEIVGGSGGSGVPPLSARTGGVISSRAGVGASTATTRAGTSEKGSASRAVTGGGPGATTGEGSSSTVRPAAGPLQTSCRSVVEIGDSTSAGMVSPDYLPDPAQRLGARLAAVGATRQIFEISGGRSIVETLPGQRNAYEVASSLVRSGYHGCWILALGTNDAADVAVGSPVHLWTRIAWMMAVTKGEPVLWVNVRTLLSTGPYAEANMQRWNEDLLAACRQYPNMRVYNWAAVVQAGWFIDDGIHYTSLGYAERALGIAGALATAFPAHGSPAPSCLVG